jgi:hypothetical protein
MRIKAVNKKNGEQQQFEVKGCELLIGSDPACDVVLAGDTVRGQHARLAQVSHHIFLRTEREENGTVKAIHQNEPGEYGTYLNWKDSDLRVDTREFQIGEYTVCAY